MNWKKVVLTLVLAAVVIFGAFFAYMLLTTKSHSPFDVATYSGQGMDIKVEYCRPYKKGRLIFGPAEEGALQPYGKYWRAGANEATEIELGNAVSFAGQNLDAGRYVLYAVPGQDEWIIGLNSQLGRWGASEVDHDKDLLQVTVPHEGTDTTTEQFTIDFTEVDGGVNLNLKWDNSLVPITIRPQ